jgi:hypothetical protein
MDVVDAVSRLIALQGTLVSVGIAVFSFVGPGWIGAVLRDEGVEAPADEHADRRMTDEVMWLCAVVMVIGLLMALLVVTPVLELGIAARALIAETALLDIGSAVFAGTAGSILLLACVRRSE